MKNSIEITGQIAGNHIIFNALATLGCNVIRTNNNGFIVEYDNEELAKQCLQCAYESLVEEEPDFSGIELSPNGERLIYDASTAKLA